LKRKRKFIFFMKAGWSFDKRDGAFIKSIMPLWSWLFQNYFFAESSGWHNIPKEKVLFVGSHNGGLSTPDLGLFLYEWFSRFGTERPLFGLMHREMWRNSPIVSGLVEKIGAVEAHPKVAIEAFKHGASVLVYPGGGIDSFRPFYQWKEINFANRRGFIKLALREKVPIVPVVSVGAHHTLYVLADFAPLIKELIKKGMPWPLMDPEVIPIWLGLPQGIGIGPFQNVPLPRKIYLRIGKPIYLVQPGDEQTNFSSKFVDECYNLVFNTMQQDLDQLISESIYAPMEKLQQMTL
jgi:1-acyl-sn-glycerol-3-phosphate acyltransferase